MKIHSISLSNINSLKGSFTIDFTTQPLRDCGLFAITGPTGAGKTTLLDALTLALFGEVARDAHVDSVMSFDCAECRAEVIFETGNGLFKSKWSRQRARGKVNGNLQPVKRELAEWPSGKIIAERISEVDKAVVEKLGLTKDQFLKSVLLAQGDFTAFLKADKNSRAELLEKMTSTDEYRVLSKRAFARFKNEEDVEKELRARKGGIQLLSEVEENLKNQDLDQLQKDVQDCNGRRVERLMDKSWFDRFEELEVAVTAAEQRFSKAGNAKENAEDVFEKWNAHQQVLPFEVQISIFFEKQNEQVKLNKSIVERTLSLDRLEENKRISSVKHEAAVAAALSAKSQLDNKRPQLQNAIAEQRLLASDEQQLRERVKKSEEKRSYVGDSRKKIDDLEKRLAKIVQDSKSNAEWLFVHQSDKKLQSAIDECRTQSDLLIGLRRDLSARNEQLKKSSGTKDVSARRLATAEMAVEASLKESNMLNEEKDRLEISLSQ